MGPMASYEAVKVMSRTLPSHMKQAQLDNLSVVKQNLFLSIDPSQVKRGDETEPGEVLMKAFEIGIDTACKKRRNNVSAYSKIASLKKNSSSNIDVERCIEARNKDGEEGIRNLPEYALAWELEMWRRSEQSKWLAEMKQQEIARISAHEVDLKKKEKQRTIEMRAFQAEQADLENKLRTTLFKLEKRERAVTIAEEGLIQRKKALERAYSNHTSNAQVAVKRLQAEYEHCLELERTKSTTFQEQCNVLEKKLLSSNNSLANIEKQFQDYKSTMRSSTESELLVQISDLKQQCSTLKCDYEIALHSKDDYKSQVMKMAKEIKKLHRVHEVQRHQANEESLRLQSQAIAATVESQCEQAKVDRLKLRQVKEQLRLLELQEHQPVIT